MITDAELARFLHDRAEQMQPQIIAAHRHLTEMRGREREATTVYDRMVNAQAQLRAASVVVLKSASGEEPL